MNIRQVYEKYNIPSNLQTHMLRVGKIANYICAHWTGKKIDRKLIRKMALVHDLGNIVKFDFEKNLGFFGYEISRIDYWKDMQKQMIEKYGADDHEATINMLKEAGLDVAVITAALSGNFSNSRTTATLDIWEPKILFYSDLRVMPDGVSTIDARFSDILKRMDKYRFRPDLGELFNACRDIEKQIQENVSIKLKDINNDTLLYDDAYLDIEI